MVKKILIILIFIILSATGVSAANSGSLSADKPFKEIEAGLGGFIENAANAEENQAATGEAFDRTVYLPAFIAGIIRAFLQLLSVVLLIVILYGGFLYMRADGSGEQVEKAKQWLVNGIIGILFALSAYIITDFVIMNTVGKSYKECRFDADGNRVCEIKNEIDKDIKDIQKDRKMEEEIESDREKYNADPLSVW